MTLIGVISGQFRRLLCLLCCVVLAGCSRGKPTPPAANAHVVGVIDGDTAELADGRKLRLIGIDTPEHGDEFYDSAAVLTRLLIDGRDVRLEYDRDQIDRYGRTLAFVWDGERLVNAEIIQSGWAWCYFFEGNLRHSRELLLAQREAMAAHRGLWKFQHPETAEYYRASFASYRFHRPECESMNAVDPELEVVYESRDSAFWDGYAPCGNCRP